MLGMVASEQLEILNSSHQLTDTIYNLARFSLHLTITKAYFELPGSCTVL